MKKLILLFALSVSTILNYSQDLYDFDLVSFGSKEHEGLNFKIVTLKKDNNRVRTKYFAAKLNGKTIGQRYEEWSKNKNVICYSSGAYMDDLSSSANLVGLTMDYGNVVNNTLITDRLHALVVVYPNGNIDVTNLGDNSQSFSGSGEEVTFNVANNKSKFIDWGKDNKLTIFQTHLLAYENELLIGNNSSTTKRERRFHIIASKNEKEVQFIIDINVQNSATLYDATSRTLNYLKSKGYSVKSIVNLDTGFQDVFRFFNYDGSLSEKLKTEKDIHDARNLIVYYYQ